MNPTQYIRDRYDALCETVEMILAFAVMIAILKYVEHVVIPAISEAKEDATAVKKEALSGKISPYLIIGKDNSHDQTRA